MPQLFGVIFLVALLIYAIPLAIMAMVIFGLIFRTKETVGLLAIGGIMVHPLIGGSIVAVLVAISLYSKKKEKRENASVAALDDPDQE